MNRHWLARIVVVLCAANLTGCGPRPNVPQQVELSVAAASDLQFAFDDLAAEFRRQHPEIRVTTTYGSSGQFFAQISQRAPFDVFFSADLDYPKRLVEAGLASTEDVFPYARGRIVLWAPDGSPLDVERSGAKALLDPAARRVAIANPKFAPYGRAAEEALKSLEVYDAVKDRLVLGENIAQTTQFVESGAAEVGILSHALTLGPKLRGRGKSWLIPDDAYPPLRQGGVILSWARDRVAAERLRAFVLSEAGQTILRRYGFEAPGE
jgi:molybdate transport system substrate-binding protein